MSCLLWKGATLNAAGGYSRLNASLGILFEALRFPLERFFSRGGYAYVNSWFSIYQGDNYKYPAVVMHEMG